MSDMTSTMGEWVGRQVVDTTGDKIGSVQDVHFDEAMDQPKWLVVKSGLFGTKKIYVPAQGVRMDGDKIRVPYTEGRVKNAPAVAMPDSLSRDEEQELSLYYGLEEQEGVMVGAPMTSSSGTDEISRGPELTPTQREASRERDMVGSRRTDR